MSHGSQLVRADANALRAKLGLAPLAVRTHEEKAAERAASEKAKEEAQKEAENEQLRLELAKRKNQRLLASEMAGPSLGDVLKKEVPSDAASWVARSREVSVSSETFVHRVCSGHKEDC